MGSKEKLGPNKINNQKKKWGGVHASSDGLRHLMGRIGPRFHNIFVSGFSLLASFGIRVTVLLRTVPLPTLSSSFLSHGL